VDRRADGRNRLGSFSQLSRRLFRLNNSLGRIRGHRRITTELRRRARSSRASAALITTFFQLVSAHSGTPQLSSRRPHFFFASRGIATLALAYFGLEQLPRELKRMPLEYFGRAIRWLSNCKALRQGTSGIAGASRGGELALLIAATYPGIKAVVGRRGLCRPVSEVEDSVSAWSYRGCDLPCARFDREAVDWNQKPIRLTPGFVASLSDAATVSAAEIPVERINGPVLLISGTDDQVWPSSLLANIAVRRLLDRAHPFLVEHACYEGAGHAIMPPHPYAALGTTHFVLR
jgi:dienelactone hydrolase